MRITMRALAGATLFAGLAGSAAAQDNDPLTRKPIQQGVIVADTAGCQAQAVTWPKPSNGPAPTGFVVKDSQGRTVRQFIDTSGGTRPNIFSFYANGIESYREVDTNANGKPDQFRWLGPNGGKTGIDSNEDGVVDAWTSLSAEELSQELFQVLVSNDGRRLAPLLPTEADLKRLGLPAGEVQQILQRSAQAGAKLQQTNQKLNLNGNAKAKWVHIELGLPYVTAGDSFGGPEDVVRHKTVGVLVDPGDNKVEVFQTGELILVGKTWKLIDGPSHGAAVAANNVEDPGAGAVVPQEVVPLVAKLNEVKPPENNAPALTIKYHTDRAAILEQIVGKLQGAQQEPWIKQVIDSYAAAAEARDDPALKRLKDWVVVIEKNAPQSAAAAYAGFRVTTTEYTVKLAALGQNPKEEDVKAVQKWWRDALDAFVNKHPNAADEAPEAMLRLANAHEFGGPDGEAQAKVWYERLAKNFGKHPYAARAEGAVRRLTSHGQPFVLNGQTLQGKAFSTAQHGGKVQVVYFYWAAFGYNTAAELKHLAELHKEFGAKGVEIVTISIDDEAVKATTAINAAQLPGTHLHSPGGTDRSPLATAYGIQMVPHVFVVGKHGKVANRNAQVLELKAEVEKLLK